MATALRLIPEAGTASSLLSSPSSSSSLFIQIPIGIACLYGLTNVVFPRKTKAPVTLQKTFYTCDEYNPGSYEVLIVRGFNANYLFNSILGRMNIHLHQTLPKFSKISLLFALNDDGGIEVFFNEVSLIQIEFEWVFPERSVVWKAFNCYKSRSQLDKSFKTLMVRKHQLLNIVKCMGGLIEYHFTTEAEIVEFRRWIGNVNELLESGEKQEEVYQDMIHSVLSYYELTMEALSDRVHESLPRLTWDSMD